MCRQSLIVMTLSVILVFMVSISSGLLKIGEYGDYHYWVEKTAMNFSETDAFCAGFGWDLVRADSEAHFVYIKSMISNHTSDNGYWTSAMRMDIFKWAKGDGNVVDQIIYPINEIPATCVVIRLPGPALYAHPCEGTPNLPVYPLCQMMIV